MRTNIDAVTGSEAGQPTCFVLLVVQLVLSANTAPERIRTPHHGKKYNILKRPAFSMRREAQKSRRTTAHSYTLYPHVIEYG